MCQLHSQKKKKNQQSAFWNIFLDLFQKSGLDICMKCQTLLLKKKTTTKKQQNKQQKYIYVIKLLSVEFALSMA